MTAITLQLLQQQPSLIELSRVGYKYQTTL